MSNQGEIVHVVQHGQCIPFDSTECKVVTRNGRKHLEYRGGRFKLAVKNCRALYGVSAHAKYGPKLNLIVTNNSIIAAFRELSSRVKSEYKLGMNNAFKPILLDDEKTGVKKLVIKLREDSKMEDGRKVQGNISPDDLCTVVIDTSIYHYGQYYGFTHKLLAVRAERVDYDNVL